MMTCKGHKAPWPQGQSYGARWVGGNWRGCISKAGNLWTPCDAKIKAKWNSHFFVSGQQTSPPLESLSSLGHLQKRFSCRLTNLPATVNTPKLRGLPFFLVPHCLVQVVQRLIPAHWVSVIVNLKAVVLYSITLVRCQYTLDKTSRVMLVVMAIALKGLSKAQMQISNLTFGGTFPVFLKMAQKFIKGNKCGRPTGEAHV